MSTTITLIVMGTLFLFSGTMLIDSTRRTRGAGSWAEDRARIALAGALYLLAVVSYGIAIANALAL